MRIATRKSSEQGPERAPTVRPEVNITWKQLFGLPFIVAIPLLALFGVFGEHEISARTVSAALDVSIVYPQRFRYRQTMPLRVSVLNRSVQILDTVTVSFDTAYVNRFVGISFDPSPVSAYVIQLTSLKPQETRQVSAELSGDEYGRHRGRIVVRSGNDSTVTHISTFVFP